MSLHLPPIRLDAPLGLAQVDPSTALLRSVAVPLLGLIVAVVVGYFAISWVRRWMRPSDGGEGGFTLDELRRLHRAGKMSDEEYARAKEAIFGSVRARTPAKTSATSSPSSPSPRETRPSPETQPTTSDEPPPVAPTRPIRPPGLRRPEEDRPT